MQFVLIIIKTTSWTRLGRTRTSRTWRRLLIAEEEEWNGQTCVTEGGGVQWHHM